MSPSPETLGRWTGRLLTGLFYGATTMIVVALAGGPRWAYTGFALISANIGINARSDRE